MPTLLLKRRETFSASHRLYNPDLTDAENEALYSKCFRNHGHNYILYVSVTGEVNPKTGMIIEFEEIKQIMGAVVQKYDHQCLNDFPEFESCSTTVENFSQIIWRDLEALFPAHINIEELELFETEKNSIVLRR